NVPVIEYINNRARVLGLSKLYQYASVTKGQRGEELSDMGKLYQAGVRILSDDGMPVENANLMRLALSYAKNFGMLIISHCEEKSLAADGVMNEGSVSASLGLKGINHAAEEVMVARDVILAESLDTRIHIAHVSTAGSVAIIRDAKRRSIKVTCETAPHYFSATDEMCLGFNTLAKVNPPLRTTRDIKAICDGLRDGTIDCIATDHAPHHIDDKNTVFNQAANGISGFETAFALAVTNLLNKNVISLPEIVRLMSGNPAHIMGIPAGTLNIGDCADITIADINRTWTVNPDKFVSKGKNTPFGGSVLTGAIMYTIVDGQIIFRRED
ncbi:MAG TPA: dihydroorotase, partial [Clostridia bacterium]|nr:dihydroorotase [Clostridia bacterium]